MSRSKTGALVPILAVAAATVGLAVRGQDAPLPKQAAARPLSLLSPGGGVFRIS